MRQKKWRKGKKGEIERDRKKRALGTVIGEVGEAENSEEKLREGKKGREEVERSEGKGIQKNKVQRDDLRESKRNETR